jgi:TonB family protein
MKTLTRLTLISLLTLFYAAGARSQTGGAWVNVSPDGEAFTVEMPQQPSPQTQQVKSGSLRATGHLYSVADANGATYMVWSLTNQAEWGKPPDVYNDYGPFGQYFDACAELTWNIVKSEVKELGRTLKVGASVDDAMGYVASRFLLNYGIREYSLTLGKRRGIVDIYSDGPQIYVVAITTIPANTSVEDVGRFLDSFTVRLPSQSGDGTVRRIGRRFDTSAGTGTGAGTATRTGVGTGEALDPARGGGSAGNDTAAGNDSNRFFSPKAVTRKAVIKSKPAPDYTDSARKFVVDGMVKLRLVLSSHGQVTNIYVIKAMPHGLTERAIEAARRIKFDPATKNGQPVSQWITIEYNFIVR